MDLKYDLGIRFSGEDFIQFLMDEYNMDEEAITELSDEELDFYFDELVFIYQLRLMNGLSKIELSPTERPVCHQYDLEEEEPKELKKTIVFRRGNLDQILRALDTPFPEDHINYRLYVDSNDDIVADVKHSLSYVPDFTYKFRIAPESECFKDVHQGSHPDHSFYYNGLPAGKRIYEYIDPPEDKELGMKICELGRNIEELL